MKFILKGSNHQIFALTVELVLRVPDAIAVHGPYSRTRGLVESGWREALICEASSWWDPSHVVASGCKISKKTKKKGSFLYGSLQISIQR